MFLKKGIEFNKMAKGFNGTFVMINELESNIDTSYSSDYSDLEQDLFFLAYICRREILDRLEEYNWSMTAPIIVPMMSRGRLTVASAFQKTIGRLYEMAEQLGISQRINDVLDKGTSYYEFDRAIPGHLKNILT